MATTPPPLPSSDEGEFDDDDFGCFTSSAPINAGRESDSEDDNHHFQERSGQQDTADNGAKNVPVMQTPKSITNLDDESNLPDIICNGKQGSLTQFEACPPGISTDESNSVASESKFENTTEENHVVKTEISADDIVKLNKTISSNAVVDSSSHVAAPISNHSFELRDNSSTEENIVSESCDSDKEKCDFNSSEIKDLQSQQAEVDDWADFSSAPSDVVQLSPENQVKGVSVGSNGKTFEPSNQIDQPSGEVDVTTANHDEFDLHSAAVKSENIESMNTVCEPSEHDIEDSCDISSNDQNSSHQTAEEVENVISGSGEVENVENIGSDDGCDVENIKSDSGDGEDGENIKSDSGDGEDVENIKSNSGNGEDVENSKSDSGDGRDIENIGLDCGEEVKNSSSEKQSIPTSNSDFEVLNEKRSSSNFAQSMNVTSNHSDNVDVPITHKSDNVDDDDDFGDFSDFTSDKVKESVSNEDVVPISFRTSTCEDEVEGEEEEDHKNFDDNKKTFDAQTDVGKSPSSCDDNGEDGEEDWGFKTADDPPKTTESEDQFGDFGSKNQSHADDADWADFNESSAPKAATSEEVAHVDEGEFQSPASSSSVMTSSQQGLSKLEKAISSSFPADHQMDFNQFERENHKNDNTGQDKDDRATEKDDMHGLDAVVSMGLKVLPSAKQETWTITKEIRIKDPMVGIWERLKDVNACHALDFGWTSSQCSQDVYNTLHIDTQNVLFSQKKQAVPFFASGLGILEPIRGGSSQPEKQNVQPPLLDTSKPEESQKEQVQDIPPVDFDWSSSGLTDPLKVFKADNFNSGLSSFEPFAEILQKSGMARQGSTEKELSTEAKSILRKIPNLRFMQSKVLMFPIKDS